VNGCCVLHCKRARGGQTEATKNQEDGLLITLAHQRDSVCEVLLQSGLSMRRRKHAVIKNI